MPNVDWKSERDRVDLAQVATGLLGPAPGRRGERGRKLWWPCPFHEDRNPSFVVTPGKPTWKCHGCGEHGDAANLLMRLERLTFPEAVARLLGGPLGPTTYRPPGRPPAAPPRPESPQGLPPAEARQLVEEAEARLWADEGSEARGYLMGERRLAAGTIRAARLGWAPRVDLTTGDGRCFTARGIVIPWFDGDRLALAKIRQPDGRRPKYAEAFRDRPSTFPHHSAFPVGRPLVVAEGEFDALLLGQELGDLAAVTTLGSASGQLSTAILAGLLKAPAWYVATDGDAAGERAAGMWPGRACRVRPPRSFKDWTEASQAGVDLHRWWADRLAGEECPELFTWAELSDWRWAGPDESPGIDIPVDAILTGRHVARVEPNGPDHGDAWVDPSA